MSDDTGGYRDHEKVEIEKAREELRRRAPITEPPQELRETPPSGAEPSEGEEDWLNGKDAQPPAEKRRLRQWWRRMFGG
jgi:hypothetical protein